MNNFVKYLPKKIEYKTKASLESEAFATQGGLEPPTLRAEI